MEGIIPAIDSSHAVAYGMRLTKTIVKYDKDIDYVIENNGIR